jgi:hypothetical protein
VNRGKKKKENWNQTSSSCTSAFRFVAVLSSGKKKKCEHQNTLFSSYCLLFEREKNAVIFDWVALLVSMVFDGRRKEPSWKKSQK